MNNISSSGKKYLKFGIMCRDYTFQAWQAQAIRDLISGGHQPMLLIMDDHSPDKSALFDRLQTYPYSHLLYRQYMHHCFRPEAKKMVSLADELRNIPVIRCQTINENFSQYFFPSDISVIREYELDFILRFGFNIIRGDILDAAEYGVWSFHHDDEQKYRGGPPGFWEICFDDPVNGAVLQRLTNRLDAGIILKKGFFKTLFHSYAAHIDRLFFETAPWPLQVANDIIYCGYDSLFREESSSAARIYRTPHNWTMLKFFYKRFRNKITFYCDDLFKAEEWNISIVRMDRQQLFEQDGLVNGGFLPIPVRHTYLADPFVFERNGQLEIMCEEYDYKLSKGIITRFSFDPVTRVVSSRRPAIKEPWHLSYPYILESGGQVYCIPESAGSRQVNVYRLDSETDLFVHFKTILEGIDAVDPTLFQYQELWWLFFTRKHLSDTHLFAYYANDLFGEYKPHNNNPLKTDVCSARPAGAPFIIAGELHRPAQDCSVTYGERVAVNKIIKLDPWHFEEETVKYIEFVKDKEKRMKYHKGLHTISLSGEYIIFDGKRFIFDRYHLWNKITLKLRRIFNL
ncbi:MAG: hypothetical protein NT175_04850 [Bacteroidetes bacterium]|nr:hypothetical protein [Bacteroidota bacterium]